MERDHRRRGRPHRTVRAVPVQRRRPGGTSCSTSGRAPRGRHRSSTTWAKGLDLVVALESDRTSGSELLAYDTQTGRAVVTDIRTSTGGTAVVRTTTWSTGWDRATALEVDGTAGSELALLNSTSGRLLLLDVATNGSAATMR